MSDETFIELTASIVAAYVTNNAVQAANLPSLIESVHSAVAGLDKVAEPRRRKGACGKPQEVCFSGLHHFAGRRPPVQVDETAPWAARHDPR